MGPSWHLSAVALLQVKETTRDVRFLHNEMFFAAAQRKYVYIYDKRGIEVHCLKVSTTLLHNEQQPIQVCSRHGLQ